MRQTWRTIQEKKKKLRNWSRARTFGIFGRYRHHPPGTLDHVVDRCSTNRALIIRRSEVEWGLTGTIRQGQTTLRNFPRYHLLEHPHCPFLRHRRCVRRWWRLQTYKPPSENNRPKWALFLRGSSPSISNAWLSCFLFTAFVPMM